MSDARLGSYISLVLSLAVMIALGVWVGCGGNPVTSSPPPGTGTVTTSLSDPATCAPPNGPYSNVWVTITKVTANITADAGPDDSGWQTLVDLTNSPKQLDLLSLASTTCVLTQLGSTTGLPPGNYQQIRLYLLDNSPASGAAVPSPNNCGGASGPFNCVVVNGSTEPLLLSSESHTGIKIPSGQIAGGGINLETGQSADINIDFNACRSIVVQGNGGHRLKPVLVAGAVSLTQNSIGGRVVDTSTLPVTPIPGAIVFLEQPDSSGIDRVVRSGVTASDGTFFFCPLPSGNYDVVAAAMVTSTAGVTTTYNATAWLAAPLGSNLDITLVQEATATGANNPPATISGLIQATSGSGVCVASTGCGVVADISLSALQSVGGSPPLLVTVPLLSGSTASVTTDSALPVSGTATSCGTWVGSGCVAYTLIVPASNPLVCPCVIPVTGSTAPAVSSATYWVNAQAFVPMSASTNPGAADCSPSSLPSSFTSGNSLSVNPGSTATENFTFTGCQ